MFSRIADRLVLQPSRHEIEAVGQNRRLIPSTVGNIEAYEMCVETDSDRQLSIRETPEELGPLEKIDLVLKFPGAGGRAELSTPHPMHLLPGNKSIIWTTNSPGYGKSEGRATVQKIPALAEAAIAGITQAYGNRQLLIVANSLGNLPALYLAARYPERIAGMMLRNPPPLRETILTKRPPWQSAFLAYGVAAAIPSEVCLVENAKSCRCPALFVTSESDSLVPPKCQDLVMNAYAGTKQTFVILEGDHDAPIPEQLHSQYSSQIQNWHEDSARFANKNKLTLPN